MRRSLAGTLGAAGGALACLWPAIAPICLHAQTSAPLTVVRLGSLRLERDPGTTGTAVFRITNPSAKRREIRAEILLPQGWRGITGTGAVALNPGSSDTRIVSFSIPERAVAGIYPVRLTASDDSQPHGSARDSVLVLVRRLRRLELRLLDAPRFAVAGARYKAGFLLSNPGNGIARVRIELRSSGGFPATMDTVVVLLPAGGSRRIPVTVSTRPQQLRSEQHVLELRAVDLDAADSSGASSSSMVEVIPRAAETTPKGPRYPVELLARAANVAGAAAPVQLSGSGALSENGATQLDFFFRSEVANPSLLGDQDEYRLSLSGKRFDLRLGDQFYSLSPLAEPGRAGFGAGGRLTLGPFTGGGFALRNRRSPFQEEEQAAFLEARLAAPVTVGVNYVALGDSAGQAWTARGVVSPGRYFGLDLEYGRGLGAAAGGEGYSVRLRNLGRSISYDLWRVQADSNFPGYYAGAVHDIASLSLRPWRQLGLTGFASRHTREPSGSTAGRRVDRSYEASAGYGAFVSLGYRHSDNTGESPIQDYATSETMFRGRLGVPLGRLWLYPTAELGENRDRVTGVRAPFQRLGFQAALSLGGGSYYISAEHTSGRTLRSTIPYRSLRGSASILQRLGPGTRLHLALNGRQPLEPAGGIEGMLDGALEQELFFGQRIALRARLRSYAGVPEAERRILFVDYTVPLGIPVASRRPSARIAGRIYDSGTGRGLPGVLVRMGDRTVVTDGSGRWAFAAVAAGSHVVELDPTSVAAGQVPTSEFPLTVVAQRGKTARVEIAMVRGAQLSGTVRMHRASEQRAGNAAAGPAPPIPLGNVIIELSGLGKTLTRMSDGNGRFDFSDLVPGRWTLKPLEGSLPRHYYFDRKALDVDLAPGSAVEIALDVLPLERRVHILDSGVVPVQQEK